MIDDNEDVDYGSDVDDGGGDEGSLCIANP